MSLFVSVFPCELNCERFFFLVSLIVSVFSFELICERLHSGGIRSVLVVISSFSCFFLSLLAECLFLSKDSKTT